MNAIFLLAPFSVLLGLIAVGAFLRTLRAGQYEDIDEEPDGPVSEGP